jgi:hypothetical protein
MRILGISILTLVLFLGGTFQSSAGPSLHGLRVAHHTFNLTDTDVAETIEQGIASLDKNTFADRLSSDDDRTGLNEFVATLALEAQSEKWHSLTVDVWVGGKDAPAGYYVRYSAVDVHGTSIDGAGAIATDKKAANSIVAHFK